MPMNPVQSWALIVLLVVFAIALVSLISIATERLDEWNDMRARRRAAQTAIAENSDPGSRPQLSLVPKPSPRRSELYDHKIHGL